MCNNEREKIAQKIYELEQKIDNAKSREEAEVYEKQLIQIVDSFESLEDFFEIDEILQKMFAKK